ncbi:hypothetical protein L0664_09185 [Octadecabacter sp. G9-8]|uniref:Dystroglycan-type cadherin-like domain-containing protein n=1 Tax=Octadecabacter dasysiphoniae TaxID=2909341 RepID=A0ABS9CVH1_9RHOB|nr:hypothetical protein [Octadecabacter dasysiphoniae]MCF2871240.1 hypothetical protein [Octadecabacter dasysiphoniae]
MTRNGELKMGWTEEAGVEETDVINSGNNDNIIWNDGASFVDEMDVIAGEAPALTTDVISGGDGDDQIHGSVASDTLYGGDGNDTLYGNDGDDTVYGDSGADAMYGGDGQDQIYGGTGDDTLNGEEGSDTLSGGDGNDTLFGGEGDDTFIIYEDDKAYGGAGTDVLDVRGLGHFTVTYDVDSTTDGVLDFESGAQVTFESIEKILHTFPVMAGLPSSVTVTEDEATFLDLSSLTLSDLDTTDDITITLQVSEGTLTAPNIPAVTLSGNGTSELTVTGPIDVLNFYLGYFVEYTGLPDAAGTAAATMTITGDDGQGEIALGAVDIDITAVNDAPVLNMPLEDQYYAEDTFVSFFLPTDAFADVDNTDLELVFSATLADGSELPDWLNFLELQPIPPFETSDVVTKDYFFEGTPPQDYFGTIEIEVTVSDGRESVADTFELVITPVDDPMTLSTSDEGGTLVGGEADDTLTGFSGDDTIYGNGGADTITDRGGNNVIDSGDGNDVVLIEALIFYNWAMGTNTVSGGEGDDLIIGGYGDEEDILKGDAGNDVIIGDRWSDVGGNPWIDVAGQQDQIIGGAGDDLLEGKGGADTFIFNVNDGNDTIGSLSNYDSLNVYDVTVIGADFVSGVDMIWLQGFDLIDAAEAMAQVTDVEGVAIFSAEGTTITFAGLTKSDLSSDDFLIV